MWEQIKTLSKGSIYHLSISLIFSFNVYFIIKIDQFEKKKEEKQKKGNKLIKKDTFVIYSEFFLPVKEGSSWFLLDTLQALFFSENRRFNNLD